MAVSIVPMAKGLALMEGAGGMSGWISSFQSTWNSASMWGELTQAAALIGLVVVFAFGYRVVRRVISGASRGKAKI